MIVEERPQRREGASRGDGHGEVVGSVCPTGERASSKVLRWKFQEKTRKVKLSDRRIRGKSGGSEGHREDHGYYSEP